MAEKQLAGERAEAEKSASAGALPRVDPKVSVSREGVMIEFRVEDLIRRIIPSAAGHCGGCYGCSGCSH